MKIMNELIMQNDYVSPNYTLYNITISTIKTVYSV